VRGRRNDEPGHQGEGERQSGGGGRGQERAAGALEGADQRRAHAGEEQRVGPDVDRGEGKRGHQRRHDRTEQDGRGEVGEEVVDDGHADAGGDHDGRAQERRGQRGQGSPAEQAADGAGEGHAGDLGGQHERHGEAGAVGIDRAEQERAEPARERAPRRAERVAPGEQDDGEELEVGDGLDVSRSPGQAGEHAGEREAAVAQQRCVQGGVLSRARGREGAGSGSAERRPGRRVGTR
jgi:hypothetical protein